MTSDSKSENGGVVSSTAWLGVPFKLKKQAIPPDPEGWVVVNVEGEEIAGLFEEKWEAWQWIAEEYLTAMTPNDQAQRPGQ